MAQSSGKKKLVVKAAMVRVEDEGGRFQYLLRGAPLDGIKASEVDRLSELKDPITGVAMVGEDDGDTVALVAVNPNI